MPFHSSNQQKMLPWQNRKGRPNNGDVVEKAKRGARVSDGVSLRHLSELIKMFEE